MLFNKNAIEAPGLDGCVEQFARNISPTSYFPSSVTRFGWECGNSEKKRKKCHCYSWWFRDNITKLLKPKKKDLGNRFCCVQEVGQGEWIELEQTKAILKASTSEGLLENISITFALETSLLLDVPAFPFPLK